MNRFLAWYSAFLLRLLGLTLRVTLEDNAGVLNKPDHPPVVMAFWHDQTALMALFCGRYCRGRTNLTFISRSRDGQFITEVAARFGVKAVRGSTSRYAVAASLAAIRAARDPRLDIVITPDGPRGPRHEIQRGLIRLAQTTQRPVVALRYELPWKFTLDSWDRFHVPLPFSACRLITSAPISVPEDATEAELVEIRARITQALGGD